MSGPALSFFCRLMCIPVKSVEFAQECVVLSTTVRVLLIKSNTIFSKGSRPYLSENTLLGTGNLPVLEKSSVEITPLYELNALYGILV